MMRGAGLLLIVVAVAALAPGCSSRRAAPNPLTPSVYLDHALALMRANDIYAQAVDWPAVTAEAHKMAAKATTASGTYAAIRYAVNQLNGAGDLHAEFFITPEAADAVTGGGGTSPRLVPPTVSLVKGRLGSIVVSGLFALPQSPNARRYMLSALSGISSLEAEDHPCGWIVDLRQDDGGLSSPMLLSVGPIIGEGRLLGATTRTGSVVWVSYRNSTFSIGGYTYRAPLKVADLAPSPPVAVLTSQLTGSSGEAVVVAFRGRPSTRSFGQPTLGKTTGTALYRLPDGASLFLGISFYTDRDGTVYKQPIKPDVSFPYTASANTVERAAEKWLLSTPACSAPH
jgi:hypothetical protein